MQQWLQFARHRSEWHAYREFTYMLTASTEYTRLRVNHAHYTRTASDICPPYSKAFYQRWRTYRRRQCKTSQPQCTWQHTLSHDHKQQTYAKPAVVKKLASQRSYRKASQMCASSRAHERCDSVVVHVCGRSIVTINMGKLCLPDSQDFESRCWRESQFLLL